MKRLSRPRSESAFIWSRMPRSWSRNHQPDPYWILPGVTPSWNERLIADVCYGNASQYFGFKS
jgi:hypothetical protein